MQLFSQRELPGPLGLIVTHPNLLSLFKNFSSRMQLIIVLGDNLRLAGCGRCFLQAHKHVRTSLAPFCLDSILLVFQSLRSCLRNGLYKVGDVSPFDCNDFSFLLHRNIWTQGCHNWQLHHRVQNPVLSSFLIYCKSF